MAGRQHARKTTQQKVQDVLVGTMIVGVEFPSKDSINLKVQKRNSNPTTVRIEATITNYDEADILVGLVTQKVVEKVEEEIQYL